MTRLFKAFIIFSVCFCALVFTGYFEVRRVYAIDASGTGTVNITDFVTPLTAISQAGFSISSGETIKYASQPGDAGGTIRMYKNTNWEQFVVDGSWIRRREDTSWAPQGDVHCNTPGDPRAVYTLTADAPPGDNAQVPGSAGWLPVSVSFTAFKASQGSSNMSIVPIDMTKVAGSNGTQRVQCPLKENIGDYPATGQAQAMELRYRPAGTFTFCSGQKNAEDLIEVVVVNGFGTGDIFYFMKGWGFVGFQDPTGRNAGLGSGGTCGAGIGFSPGPYVETPPQEPDGCIDNKYSLVIKGTVKSSRVYSYNGVDLATGVGIYTPYVYGTQTDSPMVNNLPVRNAVIEVHNSYRESSLDTRKGAEDTMNHPYNSGLLNGMFKQSYDHVKSNPDGTFQITAVSKCSDVFRNDWKGQGYEQFLSVSCPDVRNGVTGLYSKDNYGMILNLKSDDEGRTINYGDIVVDCDYDPEARYGTFAVNSDINSDGLKYMNRNRDVYMACSGTRVLGSTSLSTAESHNWNQGVKFVDNWGEGGKDYEDWWDIIIEWARKQLGMKIPFGDKTGARTEARVEIINNDYDLSQISTNIDLFTGIKGGSAERARYFLNSGDASTAGAATFNGHEEKPKIYTCEEIKRCNLSIGEEGYANDNAQTCGGSAFNLATPFGGLVKDDAENPVWELSGYIPRYLSTNKERVICTIGAQEIKILDIMPPEGYCGDVDGDGIISASEEIMPCPEISTCGDYDGDGVNVEDGERDCGTVKVQNKNLDGYENPGRYKLDVRYFPYFAMFSSTTEPLADAETRRTYTQSDSYHSMCVRGYAPEEKYIPISVGDPGGKSRPMNVSECADYGKGSSTFYTQEQVKYPGFKDNQTNYSTTVNLASTGLNNYQLPFMAVGTPQFITSADSGESVERAVAGMKATISATTRGNFYRIGMPDNLCSCSMVETTGASGLGKCQSEKGDQLLDAAPSPEEPSNRMTVGRDEGPNSGAYREWSDPIYNPLQLASQVAGGADWTWDNLFDGNSYWRHGANKDDPADTGKHYDESIVSVLGVLQDIQEFMNCNRSESWPIKFTCPDTEENRADAACYTPVHEAAVGCSRIVEHMAQNKSLTAWGLPKHDEAPLVFSESFFPPEVQMNHELSKNVSMENAVMTKGQVVPVAEKVEDMPGNQGSGYAINKGADYVRWNNLLQSMVSQPTFAVDDNAPSVPTPPGGPPSNPSPPPTGPCDFTLSMDRCDCSGMTVSASGVWGTAVGDMNMEIKLKSGAAAPVCQQYLPRWTGGAHTLSCNVPAGTYTCHHTLNYNGNGCNTNQERDITCP
jgi:hypothetical protein